MRFYIKQKLYGNLELNEFIYLKSNCFHRHLMDYFSKYQLENVNAPSTACAT